MARTVTVQVKVARDGFVYFGTALAGYVVRCPGEGPPCKPWASCANKGPRTKQKHGWHKTRGEAVDQVVRSASADVR